MGPKLNLNVQGEETSDILCRISNNEKNAVEQCIDKYSGLIWAMAKKNCFSREDAEDAVQEIFMDIWRYAGRFDQKKSPEQCFIIMIARRRLIDRVRKANHRPQLWFSEKTLDNQASEDHKKMQLCLDLKDAIKEFNRFKPQQRKIMKMSVFGEMSHLEIAATTNIPLGTVKSHIRRGLRQIRDAIGTNC